MRRIFWIAGSFTVLAIAAFGAVVAFPQISGKYIELTCSMTAPDQGCRARMVAMGHTLSIKGDLERAAIWYARVADAGEPEAMFHLAWVYQQAGNRTFKATARRA